jgi:hypothetical protein
LFFAVPSPFLCGTSVDARATLDCQLFLYFTGICHDFQRIPYHGTESESALAIRYSPATSSNPSVARSPANGWRRRRPRSLHPGTVRRGTCCNNVVVLLLARLSDRRSPNYSNPSPQGCRPGCAWPLGTPLRPGPAPEAHRPLTRTWGRHRNRLSDGSTRRMENGCRAGDTQPLARAAIPIQVRPR